MLNLPETETNSLCPLMRVFLHPNFNVERVSINETFSPLNAVPVKNLGPLERRLKLAIQKSPAGLAQPENNRLVQRRKSRTPTASGSASAKERFKFENERAKQVHAFGLHVEEKTGAAPALERVYIPKPSAAPAVAVNPSRINKETGEIYASHNPMVRFYERKWSGQYRARVEAQTSTSEPPPQNTGERLTKELNGRAASKIMDSGAFVQVTKGGFTTFLTLTFDKAARQRIISGEKTIGSEVSRFFAAAKKMYVRGWACDGQVLKEENGFECIGGTATTGETIQDGDFDYIWCAEMPTKDGGEPNPHCHVLMRWQVPPHLFADWACRIEKLWGQGFAKLERIRNAEAASGYLLKALGYIAKGSKQDQGEIKGNRYNISASARAPAWECIASVEAKNMCAIINELKDRWQLEQLPIRQEIKANQAELKAKAAMYMKAKHSKKATAAKTAENLKKRLESLTQKITEGYNQIRAKGARADEYQITFNNKEKLNQFIRWAIERRGWEANLEQAQPERQLMTESDIEAINKTRLGFGKKLTLENTKFKTLKPEKIELIKQARRAWRNALEWGRWAWEITQVATSQPEPDTDISNFLEYEQWLKQRPA